MHAAETDLRKKLETLTRYDLPESHLTHLALIFSEGLYQPTPYGPGYSARCKAHTAKMTSWLLRAMAIGLASFAFG
jgi:hypothetical protein